MKKILLIAALLTVAAQAEVYQSINIGANQSTIDSKTGNGFNIGWSGTRVWKNGILATFAINYNHSEIENETFNSYGTDLKVGYKYKDIAVFAIGSGLYQSYHSLEAAGFGYVGGLEYMPFKHFGVGAEYKTYSMTSEINEYTFDTAQAYLKILF